MQNQNALKIAFCFGVEKLCPWFDWNFVHTLQKNNVDFCKTSNISFDLNKKVNCLIYVSNLTNGI